jgi:uncharacterized membrane protein YqjE
MLKIGEIIETVKGIVETKVELVKYEIQEEFIGIVFRIMLLIFISAVGLLVLLFFSFSLAFFLSQYTKTSYMGFLMVGGLYLILMAVLYYTRYSQAVQRTVESGLRSFIFKRRNKKN